MKTKKVTRYYCDFCRKGMLKHGAMLSHECHCIMNPKRDCYLCEDAIQVKDLTALVSEFKSRSDVMEHEDFNGNPIDFFGTDSQAAIDWLSEKCGNCPECMLAVLKQGKVLAFSVFNYKERAIEYLSEKNREHWEGVSGFCQ